MPPMMMGWLDVSMQPPGSAESLQQELQLFLENRSSLLQDLRNIDLKHYR